MSDFFESAGDFSERLFGHYKTADRAQVSNREFHQSLLEPYRIKVSDEEARAFYNAIAGVPDIEDEAWRMAAAMNVAQRYPGMSYEYARQNIEYITDALVGAEEKKRPGKTVFKELLDHFALGQKQFEYSDLGWRLQAAEAAGNEEETARLWREHDALMAEMERLSSGGNKVGGVLGVALNIMGQVFETVPYMAYVAGMGFVGSLATPAAGVAAAGLAGTQLMAGSEYIDLRRAGVEPGIARGVALASGAAQSAVEVLLGGVVGKTIGAAGRAIHGGAASKGAVEALIRRVTNNTFKDMKVQGVGLTLARFLVKNTDTALGEAAEEAAQEFISMIGLNLALELQKEDVDTPMIDIMRIAEAAGTGFVVSFILGIPSTISTMNLDRKDAIQEAEKLRALAIASESQEAFNEVSDKSPLFKDMPADQKKNTQTSLYEGTTGERERRATLLAEAEDLTAVRNYDEGAEAAPQAEYDEEGNETASAPMVKKEYRNTDETLFTETAITSRKEGETRGVFKAGDPTVTGVEGAKAKNQYGYIRFADDGRTVRIEQFTMVKHREALRGEVFSEFARRFAGKHIAWDTRSTAEAAIKAELIQNNSRGADAGLDYFETPPAVSDIAVSPASAAIGERIHKAMPAGTDPHIAALAAEVFRAFADRKFGGIENAFKNVKFTTEANSEVRVAQKDGAVIKGAQWAAETAEGLKQFVYFSEHADMSTAVHELGHVIARSFSDGEIALLAEALDGYTLQDGRAVSFQNAGAALNEEQQEAFSEALENYLSTRTVHNEAARPLFEKVKALLRKIYHALKQWHELSPEAEAFFNDFLSGDIVDKARAREADAAVEAERRVAHIAEERLTDPDISAEEKTRVALDEAAHAAQTARSVLPAVRDAYQNARRITGDSDDIQIGDRQFNGVWRLVEADAVTASHDEYTFNPVPLFEQERGSTVNDRDYFHDAAAQEAVITIGAAYDRRALSYDNPVIVTSDGVVISGNNRTMSGKRAAHEGTDRAYRDYLMKSAGLFGFTKEQVSQFEHPRVVFELTDALEYTTETYALFNVSDKKALSPLETAVKVSKIIRRSTIESIAGTINQFDTLSELYADGKAAHALFNTLINDGIIAALDKAQYITESGITPSGKSFIETVMVGGVLTEGNVRALEADGVKNLRRKIVRAIPNLIENNSLSSEYRFINELNEAVAVAIDVFKHKDKFKNVTEYAYQQSLFEEQKPPLVYMLAQQLEGTEKHFASFIESAEIALYAASSGAQDLFGDAVKSRDDILELVVKAKPDTLYQTLFQRDEVSESLVDEALMFDTWQEFMAYNEKEGDAGNTGGYTQADKERWYQTFFENARKTRIESRQQGQLISNPEEAEDSASDREDLARTVGDTALSESLRDGSLTFDSERFESVNAETEALVTESEKRLADLNAEHDKAVAAVTGEAERYLLDQYDALLAARDTWQDKDETIRNMIRYGIIVSEEIQKQNKQAKDVYDEMRRNVEALREQAAYSQALAAAIARKEAVSEERRRNTELHDKKAALQSVRRLKKAMVKRIMRPARLESVYYDDAHTIYAIQQLIAPSIIRGLETMLGPAERFSFDFLSSRFASDDLFRDMISAQVRRMKWVKQEDKERILSILQSENPTKDEEAFVLKYLGKRRWNEALGISKNLYELEFSFRNNEIRKKDGDVILDEELERLAKDALPQDVFMRIKDKEFSHWSFEQAEELARILDTLTIEGKKRLQAIRDARAARDERYRQKILEAIKKTNIVINPGDDEETIAKKQAKINKTLNTYAMGVENSIEYNKKKERWDIKTSPPNIRS
jgi:hypothetical protein